uniref:Membrane insertase YidC/Oxa/ALB C-terminal domain-containing protein n=1 Tax=Lotharella globosa TaxID=91324 RepID=A0A7S3YQV7_9EUKA
MSGDSASLRCTPARAFIVVFALLTILFAACAAAGLLAPALNRRSSATTASDLSSSLASLRRPVSLNPLQGCAGRYPRPRLRALPLGSDEIAHMTHIAIPALRDHIIIPGMVGDGVDGAVLVAESMIQKPTIAQDLPQMMALVGDSVDAAKDGVTAAAAAAASTNSSPGWLKGWTDILELVLATVQSKLDKAGIPYSYGWSIIILTLFVKTLTFPLTKKQVESSIRLQQLRPRLKSIEERYERSPEIVDREKQILYEDYDVNPTASLFPTLATIPIFLGLFYSLRNVASQGLLDDQGFFFIPTLGGPTTFADRQAGTGLQWLWPFVNGEPPVGWDQALRYIALPAAVVVAQLASSQILKMDTQSSGADVGEFDINEEGEIVYEKEKEEAGDEELDDEAKSKKNVELVGKVLQYVLPLVVGYFTLNVPSGLALYYLSNTLISSAQQSYLRQYGGLVLPPALVVFVENERDSFESINSRLPQLQYHMIGAEIDEEDVGEIPPGYGIQTGELVDDDEGSDVPETPEWLDRALEGDEEAWPLYKNLDFNLKQFKEPDVYCWSENIQVSEFDPVLEKVGPPPAYDEEMVPGINDLISNGQMPSEHDEFFWDEDLR